MRNFIKLTHFVVFLLLIPQLSFSQQIAIIGFNGSSPDGISFVALEAIPGGTTIYFTDNEHLGGGEFNTGEGVWDWVAPLPNGMAKGDVVEMTEDPTNLISLTCTGGGGCGTSIIHTTPFALATGTAETVSAYTDTDTDPSNGTTEIHSSFISFGALPAGEDPTGFSPNALVLDGLTTVPHAQYSAALRSLGPTSKADLENPANYTQASGNVNFSVAPFTNIVLPVELIQFTVRGIGGNVALSWTTAPEINNDGFEVEHSTDGINWDKIGFFKGNGNSANVNKYDFIHENPKYSINYYRLKQIDFDGKFEYSKIVSLNIKGENGQIGELYPNPSNSGLVNLNYISQSDNEVAVSVFDMTGKQVVNQLHQISKVNNNLNFDFSTLYKGIYIVKIGNERIATHRKLIIE